MRLSLVSPLKRRGTLAPLCLLRSLVWIALLGTTSAQADDVVVWEKNKNVYVKLVDAAVSGNEHPATVASDSVTYFLANLYAGDKTETSRISKKRSKGQGKHLFTSEQTQLLAEQLPKALAMAKPGQDVRFVIDQRRSSLGGLRTRDYYTAGTVFVADGALQLIIGDYDRERNYNLEAIYDPSRTGLVKYDFNYGSRSDEGSSDKNLRVVFSSFNDDESVQNETDAWVAATLKLLPEKASAWFSQRTDQAPVAEGDFISRSEVEKLIAESRESANAERVETTDAAVAARAATTATSDTAISSTPVVAGRSNTRTPRVAGAPSAGASTSVDSNQESGDRTLEERFALLTRLKEKGLITEDEYQKKRMELLSQI